MSRIDPYSDLSQVLLSVEKPGRYAGGEYGIVLKDRPLLHVAISYPDLYEIGMSNLALRLLYQMLNSLEGVHCERVFAPAEDFEAELRARGIPLYSLETGTPLRELDLVGFSVGYELTLTNLLNILDLGGIAPLCRDRREEDPLILAGGPAVTNPLPFGSFVDAVFIGEFEGVAAEVVPRLRELKSRGASRSDLQSYLWSLPWVWAANKRAVVRRAIWRGFGDVQDRRSTSASAPAERLLGTCPPAVQSTGGCKPVSFPVPNVKAVQDHGIVEIMRGCPNGCRFCHAGVFYRPFRQKDAKRICREVEEQVFRYGYREVTLSSLSSGDYPDLPSLVRGLTARFQPYKVSFSMPSLRVDSLTLDLLSEISTVRKSGLTFAVETPLQDWQLGLNKPVTLDRTLELLAEARQRGWRTAKFYFMVGLPVARGGSESEAIIEFLGEVRRRTRMSLNVNVSCFIPKPHTPFQWAAQLGENQALDRIMTVKRALSSRGITVRYHSPFLSLLEGVVSRGEERVGELFYRAFREGARFDAWEEKVKRQLWKRLFAEAGWEVEAETCRPRDLQEPLPWKGIQLGVSNSFLLREYDRALRGEPTAPCCPGCEELCGVCGKNVSVRQVEPTASENGEIPSFQPQAEPRPGTEGRVLFSFVKKDKAVFLGHLDLMQILERALLRAGYVSRFTEGFNPKPRLEFAQPLSLGIASEGEIALAEIRNFDGEESFRGVLNEVLPEGIRLRRIKWMPPYRAGEKKRSLMSLYWGSEYRIEAKDRSRLGPLVKAVNRCAAGEALEVLERRDAGMLVLVGRSGKGTGNIVKLLERCGLPHPLSSGVAICRTRVMAKHLDTHEPVELQPAVYFDLDF
jgi:radical SAM family uncharacterized protein/radical SAM-linked protein